MPNIWGVKKLLQKRFSLREKAQGLSWLYCKNLCPISCYWTNCCRRLHLGTIYQSCRFIIWSRRAKILGWESIRVKIWWVQKYLSKNQTSLLLSRYQWSLPKFRCRFEGIHEVLFYYHCSHNWAVFWKPIFQSLSPNNEIV